MSIVGKRMLYTRKHVILASSSRFGPHVLLTGQDNQVMVCLCPGQYLSLFFADALSLPSRSLSLDQSNR